MIGQVKWFNKKSGYGFVKVLSGDNKNEDIFVHHTQISTSANVYKTLTQGEYVEYLSGIVTDSSIREGDQAPYRVVVKLPKDIDPDSPTHWTQEINWVSYPIPQK